MAGWGDSGWWPGKNIGRPEGGWVKRGLSRNSRLKERGLNRPDPQYDQGTMNAMEGAAGRGATATSYGRSGLAGAMDMYRNAAEGNAPSVAENQMRQGADQSIANQMSMQAQGSGGNLASAQRAGAASGAAIGMQTNADAANLRAAEIAEARQGLAAASQGYMQGGLGEQQMGLAGLGQASGQQLAADTQWGLGQRGLDLEQLQGNREFGMNLANSAVGAIGTAAGVGMMFSDERAKLPPSGGAATDAVREAGAVSFEYAPGMGPPGERTGFSANRMAQTPAGAAVVSPDPQTGMLQADVGQLAGLNTAAQAETINRVDRIERILAGMPTGVGREGFTEMSGEAREPKKKKKRKGLASSPTRPVRPGSSRVGDKTDGG